MPAFMPVFGSQHTDMHGKVTIEPPHLGVPGKRNIPVYRDATKVCFGRAPHNDVVCDDEYVSYEHAVIYWDPYIVRIVIADLNSTNGTWLNGKRLTPMEPTPLGSSDTTISFAHGLQSEEHPEMDHEPWMAHYTLLPKAMIKEDWLEEAYDLKDDPDIAVPSMELRLQMVLADIKAQRVPYPATPIEDSEDSDSDATVVPPSTSITTTPERPSTPIQPVPPPFAPSSPRALRREPPIHLEYSFCAPGMYEPNLLWSSKCTRVRPDSDKDEGRVPPYVYEWSIKHQLPQGLHPLWNEYAEDRYFGKDPQIDLEKRMNEAEEAVHEFELEQAAHARAREEPCEGQESAPVDPASPTSSMKRKRELDDDGDECASDDLRTGAPPHPGRFAPIPCPVLRPARSSHAEASEPCACDDTPRMPGAWMDFVKHCWPFYEDPVVRSDDPSSSIPSASQPSPRRASKRLRFSEEVVYVGRVVG